MHPNKINKVKVIINDISQPELNRHNADGRHLQWDGLVMKNRARLLFIVSFVVSTTFLFGCSPLQNRIKENVSNVNYTDGIDKYEANSIAEYYRLNNLNWVNLVGPSDGGDYWIFKLTKAQTNEHLDSPPVLILKNAWSLESAVSFDKSAY